MRGDSVSLLRFPFLSYVHVLSCEMSLVSPFKRPQSCFSSQFCFLAIVVSLVLVLSVLFLAAVISLPPRFPLQSSSRCINMSTLSSMLANYISPSLHMTHIVCQGLFLDVMPYAWSLVFLCSGPLKFFSGQLYEWSRVSNEGGEARYLSLSQGS